MSDQLSFTDNIGLGITASIVSGELPSVAHAETPSGHLAPRHRQPRERGMGGGHGYPYMNRGESLDVPMWLKDIYIDTPREAGIKPGPGYFGYLLKACVADTY